MRSWLLLILFASACTNPIPDEGRYRSQDGKEYLVYREGPYYFTIVDSAMQCGMAQLAGARTIVEPCNHYSRLKPFELTTYRFGRGFTVWRANSGRADQFRFAGSDVPLFDEVLRNWHAHHDAVDAARARAGLPSQRGR